MALVDRVVHDAYFGTADAHVMALQSGHLRSFNPPNR
jgi:hypothetical protein